MRLLCSMIWIAIWISIVMTANKGTPNGATQSNAKQAAGKAIDNENDAGQQEGVVKVRTGDLCEGNPKHSDPQSTVEFIPACATCISKAAVEGQSCYENTWTFQTHCECDSMEFTTCHCWRSLNYLGTFSYVFLPIITLAVIIVIQVCMRYTFCPVAKMEKELQEMQKKEARKKKAGASQKGTIDSM